MEKILSLDSPYYPPLNVFIPGNIYFLRLSELSLNYRYTSTVKHLYLAVTEFLVILAVKAKRVEICVCQYLFLNTVLKIRRGHSDNFGVISHICP